MLLSRGDCLSGGHFCWNIRDKVNFSICTLLSLGIQLPRQLLKAWELPLTVGKAFCYLKTKALKVVDTLGGVFSSKYGVNVWRTCRLLFAYMSRLPCCFCGPLSYWVELWIQGDIQTVLVAVPLLRIRGSYGSVQRMGGETWLQTTRSTSYLTHFQQAH